MEEEVVVEHQHCHIPLPHSILAIINLLYFNGHTHTYV